MHKDSKRREALLYHAKPTPGKIQVIHFVYCIDKYYSETTSFLFIFLN